MSKSVCYTCAYNAEDTIRRAIESVLSQTCPDIIYYICDNGSTDKTREIIMEYAQSDSRIIPILRELNHLHPDSGGGNPAIEFISTTLIDEFEKGNAEYFFDLDADDEYHPDFLAKMLSFLGENDLDVAACDNRFIMGKLGETTGTRGIKENLIIEGDGFGTLYPRYFAVMRPIWGKLYRIALLKKCDFANYRLVHEATSSVDTFFNTHAFFNADRAGILAEPLISYYMTEHGVSRNFDSSRVATNKLLFDTQTEYLIDKAGGISDDNKEFLLLTYYCETADTIATIIRSGQSDVEKLDMLYELFTMPLTREAAAYQFTTKTGSKDIDYNANRIALFQTVSNWIIERPALRTGKQLERAADVLAVLGVVYTESDEISNVELFNIFTKTYQKSKSASFKRQLEALIIQLASHHPLLTDICTLGEIDAPGGLDVPFDTDVQFVVFFSDIISRVLEDDLESALDMILEVIADELEIPDTAGLPLVELGLNIAAELEAQPYFVYLKKLQISLQIDMGLLDKAAAELDEWCQLMPHDTGFQELAERL